MKIYLEKESAKTMRKLGWLFRILYNLLRFKVKYVLSLGKFKSSMIEIVSHKVDIKINNGGSIELKEKCTIDDGTLIRSSGGKIKIGNKVYINRNCNIVSMDSIVIQDGTTIGPNVCIYDHDHIYKSNCGRGYNKESVLIGKNVWIGANVVILKGTRIGDNCVIGAGSVVKGNINNNTLVFQNRTLEQMKI